MMFEVSLEDRMDLSKRMFEELGFTRSLVTALELCHKHNMAPPEWLVKAIDDVIVPFQAKRSGRGTRSEDEKFEQFTIDLIRSSLVSDLRTEGISSREIYQAASDRMANSEEPVMRWAGGSAEAIRRSCRRQKKSNRSVFGRPKGKVKDV